MLNSEEVRKYEKSVLLFLLSICTAYETESTDVSCNFVFFVLVQGITFGDFTAEEWKKYFNNSAAQIGNSPPVEVSFLRFFVQQYPTIYLS